MTRDDLLRLAPITIPIAGSIAALLCDAVLGKRALARLVAASALVAALVALLGGAVGLGGYADSLFFLNSAAGLLAAAAAAFALGALLLTSRADEEEYPGELAALLLLVPAGVGLVAGARHLILIFLGIELLSIPLYALVGLRRKRPGATEGAVKYFLLGAFAAGFLAYGAALLFAAEGTLDLTRLHGAAGRSMAGAAGAGLVLTGLLFKVSAAPFHFWTPDAYEGASTPITALMASATKVAAVAGLLLTTPLLPASAWPALAAVSILTIAAGNFGALLQDRVKRLLAYSSVAHAGTILLALAAERSASEGPAAADVARAVTTASTFYLAAYGASVLGAFGVLTILEGGGERFASLADFRGLWRRRPGLALLLAFFLLSLGGLPPTGGFWAKYLVFSATVDAGRITLAVVAIVLSVIGAAYYLKVVSTCFMSAEEEGASEPPIEPAHWPALLATLGAAAFVLVLGLFPSELLAPLAR